VKTQVNELQNPPTPNSDKSQVEGIGGRYFEDCNEAGPSQPGTGHGVAAYALDPQAALRLWEISLQTLEP
jgi:hypothetical protein